MIAHSSLTTSVTLTTLGKQIKNKKNKIDMIVIDEKLIKFYFYKKKKSFFMKSKRFGQRI